MSILGVLVMLGGVAPLCSMTQVAKPMPCCSRSSHCAAGMTSATACCAMTPSPAKGQPQPRSAPETGLRAAKAPPSAVAADRADAAPGSIVAAFEVPRTARDGSVPIFLLNATLLR